MVTDFPKMPWNFEGEDGAGTPQPLAEGEEAPKYAAKDHLFAIRQHAAGRRYELYVCTKEALLAFDGRFPWVEIDETSDAGVLDAIGEWDEVDNGLYWMTGDLEDHRLRLSLAGLEERPEILDRLREYPPEQSGSDW